MTRFSSALLLLAAAAFPQSCTAQDWGTVGAWQQLAPTNLGPALGYRHATSVAGSVVMLSNDTATGAQRVVAYDVAANAWSTWPADLQQPAMRDPNLFTIGGQVFVVDETDTTSVAYIDSDGAAGNTWVYPSVTGGPAVSRIGERFIAWGSTIYTFGGVDLGSTTFRNDVWALDSAALLATRSGAWQLAAADGMPGMPPGRMAYTLTAFGAVIVMYGGVSIDANAPPGTDAGACYNPARASVCHFHEGVWLFLPGNKQAGAGTVTAAQWQRLPDTGAYGAPGPVGRMSHVAGAMGDQLFVYGGITASGATTELWAFNLVTQTWQQVAYGAPAPTLAGDIGMGAGLVVGRHLYKFVQQLDPASGRVVPFTGQMWRWAPSASAGAGSPPPPTAPLHPGAVAAIVVTILLTAINSALLVALARNGGALPDWLACGGGGGGGYKRPAAPVDDGFYSSAPTAGAGAAAAAGAGGGYVAPA
jgi:hypothetical protein